MAIFVLEYTKLTRLTWQQISKLNHQLFCLHHTEEDIPFQGSTFPGA